MSTQTFFPALRTNTGPSDAQATAFQQALYCDGQQETKFRTIYDRFSLDSPTDTGIGSHYLHGLVGTAYAGARATIYAVAGHQGMPVLDLTTMTPRELRQLPIREIVQRILHTPPRCAIIVALEEEEESGPCHMRKVLARISKQQLDLRYRRVVFCLAESMDRLPPGIQSETFPGSTDDKLQMLLYRVPPAFADAARLRPIAATMPDYAVFEPRIWRHVMTCGAAGDFFATLTFQVHRRKCMELDQSSLDDFPSFETPWRRAFASELQKTLRPTPDATCPGLHRVLPVGVSHEEALQCIQTALPVDLTDPYALTVATDAVDDQCGSIVVTQPTHHCVVTVQCNIDPGILSSVCRELRTNHREITQEMSRNKSEMQALARAQAHRFDLMQGEMAILKELMVAGGGNTRPQPQTEAASYCRKKGCKNRVVERFSNGKRKKQCSTCITMGNQARVGAKSLRQTSSPCARAPSPPPPPPIP